MEWNAREYTNHCVIVWGIVFEYSYATTVHYTYTYCCSPFNDVNASRAVDRIGMCCASIGVNISFRKPMRTSLLRHRHYSAGKITEGRTEGARWKEGYLACRAGRRVRNWWMGNKKSNFFASQLGRKIRYLLW